MSSSITYLGKKVWPRVKANQYKRESWLSLKWRQVKYWTRITLQIVAIAGVLALAATIGALVYGNQIVVQNTLVTPEKGIPSVLHRIAVAESGDSQFGKNGQLTIHVNSDGSYDQGKYQINSTWNATASKMGYNLAVEKDNEAFATWLFDTHGSEPWKSSISNWNR